jgi:hypothetical protein
MKKDGKIKVQVGAKAVVSPYNSLHYLNGKDVAIEGRSIDDIIEQLIDIRDGFSSEYTNITLEGTSDCGCYDQCACAPTYYATGMREMNDVEREFYNKLKKEREEMLAERDRKEYERLKKRFG